MPDMIEATCHCGAVHLRAKLAEPLSEARRCDCSFCRRRQAANVSAHWSSVDILAGADDLRCYTFGTHKAQHYFCGTCGIYTHHRRYSDPSLCGINIYCIDGNLPARLEPLPWLDGINYPERP